MKIFSKVAALTLGLAFASTASYADKVTLTLTGTSGANNGTYSNNDIQEAVWYLSVSNPGSVPTTPSDPTLLPAASNAVTQADLGGGSTFDNGQFTLYTAVPGTQNPSTDGTPQSLVGDSPVPEPRSLLLLASGLFGCAAVVYRIRRAIALP
jgi:hypothetical protein